MRAFVALAVKPLAVAHPRIARGWGLAWFYGALPLSLLAFFLNLRALNVPSPGLGSWGLVAVAASSMAAGAFESIRLTANRLTVRAIAELRLRWAKEGVDDLDKVSSFDAGEAPRRSASSLEAMAGIRAKVRDPSDDCSLTFRRELDTLLDAAAADASAQSLLNVVILTAANGNELSVVVGSAETVLGFTAAGSPSQHFASVGAVQTIEPVLTAYVGLRHHTEFPRRNVISSALGRAAAAEFFDTGARPTSVSWEVV